MFFNFYYKDKMMMMVMIIEVTQICYEACLINENTANYYMLYLANLFTLYHSQYRLFSFWSFYYCVSSKSDWWRCAERNSPANVYFLKVNDRNARKKCEICSNLTIKTRFSSVSIIDFEQINVSQEYKPLASLYLSIPPARDLF